MYIVIAAAGNEGSQGAFTIGSPSVGKGVISVASFNNGYTLKDTILVKGVKNPLGMLLFSEFFCMTNFYILYINTHRKQIIYIYIYIYIYMISIR